MTAIVSDVVYERCTVALHYKCPRSLTVFDAAINHFPDGAPHPHTPWHYPLDAIITSLWRRNASKKAVRRHRKNGTRVRSRAVCSQTGGRRLEELRLAKT